MIFKKMKKKIKKKGAYKIFILGIMAVLSFFTIISISNAAYERPEFSDGLYASWHPGSFCIPCHYSLNSVEKAKNISIGCQNCHQYKPKGSTKYDIDMSKIFNIHKDIICIRCHIGIKNQKEVTAQDFHRIMPIACNNCHNYSNGTYQIPEKKNCSDCHANGDPHVVHSGDKRLEKICIACHGEDFANKYISGAVQINVSKLGIISVGSATGTAVEYPTIGKFLENIFKMIGILK